MPYLIPSNMTGDEDIGSVCVHYPDLPEFKAALLGALSFFTKWVAWERTDDKSARVAAELWYKAHLLTIAGWDSECGDCDDMPSDEHIIDLIEQEIEKMSITNCITVNCGCGSGCGGGGISGEPPVDYEGDDLLDTLDEPIEIPDETPSYQQYKCNAAHYLYYKFRTEVILKLAGLKDGSGLDYDDVTKVLVGLQSPLSIAASVIWEYYHRLVTWLVQQVSESGGDIAVELDRHYDEFVCAAFSGDGVNEKRDGWYAVIDNCSLSWATRYYLKMLSQSIDWENWFYGDWETSAGGLPVGYTERDCSGCGTSSTPLPDGFDDVGGGYQILTVYPSSLSISPRGGDGDGVGTVSVAQDGVITISGNVDTEYSWGTIGWGLKYEFSISDTALGGLEFAGGLLVEVIEDDSDQIAFQTQSISDPVSPGDVWMLDGRHPTRDYLMSQGLVTVAEDAALLDITPPILDEMIGFAQSLSGQSVSAKIRFHVVVFEA